MSGYIFDHRKELESDVWLLPPMYHRVWQWIKYKVNHAPGRIPNKDGTFTTLLPGQHATSYRLIAKGVGYYEGLKWKEPNPKTVKTILNWLETQGMIGVKGNTLGTVITVANWELYQKEIVKGNAVVTPKKHELDTNKKNKEELKKNKDNIIGFDTIRKCFPGTKTLSVAKKKLPQLIKKYSEDELIRACNRYKKFVDDKRKKDQPNLNYVNESTFWNGRYMDYLDECYEEQEKPKTVLKVVHV